MTRIAPFHEPAYDCRLLISVDVKFCDLTDHTDKSW